MKKILRALVGVMLLAGAVLATVTNPLPSVSYACNGVTAAFNVNFPYITYTDLVVTSTTTPGVVTTLVYSTNYTTSVTSTTTAATLTLLAPAATCPTGSTLKIARTRPLLQLYSFKAQTTYNPALHETAYDSLEMQIQQVDAKAVALLVDAGTDYMTLTTVQTATGAKTFTGGLISATIAANTNGISASGQGTGYGVQGVGGASNGIGVVGFGSNAAAGVSGSGGTGGNGVNGFGSTTGVGVSGLGGNSSSTGVVGNGGATNGSGVVGTGAGTGSGVKGTGGATGFGVLGLSNGASTPAGTTMGVVGMGGGAGAIQNGSTGDGVYGHTVTANAFGVEGITSNNSAASAGVRGACIGSACFGVQADGYLPPGAGTGGVGLKATGGGSNGGTTSGNGIVTAGGPGTGGSAGGHGIVTTGGSGGGGYGAVATGSGSGGGLSSTGGATGDGIFANSGSASNRAITMGVANPTNPVVGALAYPIMSNTPTIPANGDTWVDGFGFTAKVGGTNYLLSNNPMLAANTAAGQSIPNNAVTIVVYGTVERDSDSAYNSGTGRFTVPTGKGGDYLVTGQITWNAAVANTPAISIYKNAALLKQNAANNVGASQSEVVTSVINLAAGDIIDIRAFQTSGGAIVLNATAALNHFSLKRMP